MKTRFETKAHDNSKMAFLRQLNLIVWSVTEAIFGALKQYNGGHHAKLILWEV